MGKTLQDILSTNEVDPEEYAEVFLKDILLTTLKYMTGNDTLRFVKKESIKSTSDIVDNPDGTTDELDSNFPYITCQFAFNEVMNKMYVQFELSRILKKQIDSEKFTKMVSNYINKHFRIDGFVTPYWVEIVYPDDKAYYQIGKRIDKTGKDYQYIENQTSNVADVQRTLTCYTIGYWKSLTGNYQFVEDESFFKLNLINYVKKNPIWFIRDHDSFNRKLILPEGDLLIKSGFTYETINRNQYFRIHSTDPIIREFCYDSYIECMQHAYSRDEFISAHSSITDQATFDSRMVITNPSTGTTKPKYNAEATTYCNNCYTLAKNNNLSFDQFKISQKGNKYCDLASILIYDYDDPKIEDAVETIFYPINLDTYCRDMYQDAVDNNYTRDEYIDAHTGSNFKHGDRYFDQAIAAIYDYKFNTENPVTEKKIQDYQQEIINLLDRYKDYPYSIQYTDPDTGITTTLITQIEYVKELQQIRTQYMYHVPTDRTTFEANLLAVAEEYKDSPKKQYILNYCRSKYDQVINEGIPIRVKKIKDGTSFSERFGNDYEDIQDPYDPTIVTRLYYYRIAEKAIYSDINPDYNTKLQDLNTKFQIDTRVSSEKVPAAFNDLKALYRRFFNYELENTISGGEDPKKMIYHVVNYL